MPVALSAILTERPTLTLSPQGILYAKYSRQVVPWRSITGLSEEKRAGVRWLRISLSLEAQSTVLKRRTWFEKDLVLPLRGWAITGEHLTYLINAYGHAHTAAIAGELDQLLSGA